LRRLRIAAPVQPTLALSDEHSDPHDRWWSLPDESRRQVLALLARLIARGVIEEGEQL
jgi:hypothetical protein